MLLCRRDGLGGVHAHAVAAVLADQSVDRRAARGSTSSSIWCAALWAMLPAAILWGASFPLALASVASGRPGSGAAGRRRLRRQHPRRDRRRRSRPACCWSSGSAASSAQQAADRAVGDGGAARARRRVVEAVGNGAVARQMRLGSTLLLVGAAMLAALARAQRRRGPRRSSSPTAATPPRRIGQADVIYMGEGWNASVAVTRLVQRRAQLSQRRQGAGVERAAGHAPAADARAHDDADSDGSEARAGDRLRRRRHRRRRVDRSAARAGDDRRDRAARAACRLEVLRRSTTSTSSRIRRRA